MAPAVSPDDATTAVKAPKKEPQWVTDARDDYDSTATVGAMCVLTSKRAPWSAKVIATFVAAAQIMFLVLVLVWAQEFKKERNGAVVCSVEQCTSPGPVGGTKQYDCYAPNGEAKTCKEGYWVQHGVVVGNHPDTYSCCEYQDHRAIRPDAPMTDKIGFIGFLVLINVCGAFGGNNNVGTLDPSGCVSVYGGWLVNKDCRMCSCISRYYRVGHPLTANAAMCSRQDVAHFCVQQLQWGHDKHHHRQYAIYAYGLIGYRPRAERAGRVVRHGP